MFNSKTLKVSLILLTLMALVATPAIAKVEVGSKFPVRIDSATDYRGSEDGAPALVWQHEIYQPGGTYIAVHFSDFRLAPGDELVITDGKGGQRYTLTGRGKMGAGKFWARHVKGDTMQLELWATSASGAQGLQIDEIAVGNEDFPGDFGPEAICGVDDKDNAVCYESTYPTEYDRSRAVARMLIGGMYLCTGWLVTADDKLLTNEHCVTSAAEALNTDFEFMAEAPNCNDSNCQLCYSGQTVSGGTFLRDNASLDYSLIQLSGNLASTYGYLQIDDRAPIVGDEIYIPQHPSGRAKELGIFSSAASDASDGFCHVNTVSAAPCSGSGYNDVGYYCDTEGGSSGSPVLARSSHKVIALHHCANCPNRGVPISLVYADIADLLGPECTTDADCDDGLFCNGLETCSAETCKEGTDPCPGENCDETNDVCVPLVCDNDGVCESGEDCNNCGSDCISGTSGSVCGDGVCEIGAGEDCNSCPADCNGVTTGKPSNRYCCGDDFDCSDLICASNGNICDSVSGGGVAYCCGDGTCGGDENSVNCEVDCGPPPCGDDVCDPGAGEDKCSCSADCGAPPSTEATLCADGFDNDCDGQTDCVDDDCIGDPSCDTCSALGEICSNNADCCSSTCRGKGGIKTCI